MSVFKKYISLFGFALAVFSLVSVPILAAEFYPKNSEDEIVEVESTRENVYASGATVNISNPVARDIVASGAEINVTTTVGRSLILAGQTVNIKSEAVGGASRIAGQTVVIEGSFGEELVVAGQTITIKNSQIEGDLVLVGQKIVVENSIIAGRAYVSGQTIEGNLEEQVVGEVKSVTEFNENDRSIESFPYLQLSVAFSVIVFTALAVFHFNKRGHLIIEEADFRTSGFWLRAVAGLGVLIGSMLILGASVLVFLAPLGLIIWALLNLVFWLSYLFLPIYLANAIKNTFKFENPSLLLTIPIAYLIIIVLSFVPVLNIVGSLLVITLWLSAYAFLLEKGIHNLHLDPWAMHKKTKKKVESKHVEGEVVEKESAAE